MIKTTGNNTKVWPPSPPPLLPSCWPLQAWIPHSSSSGVRYKCWLNHTIILKHFHTFTLSLSYFHFHTFRRLWRSRTRSIPSSRLQPLWGEISILSLQPMRWYLLPPTVDISIGLSVSLFTLNSCKGDPPTAEPSQAKRTKEMKLGPAGTKNWVQWGPTRVNWGEKLGPNHENQYLITTNHWPLK